MSSLSRDSLHLFILSAFAVAQPLFSLLAGEATFFSVRRSESIDLLLMVLGLILLVPLPMIVVEVVAGLFGARARRALHLVFVGGLVAIVLLPYLKRIQWAGSILIAIALVLGIVFAVIYARRGALWGFVSYLAPVLLIFPVMFLGSSSVRQLLFPPEIELPAASNQPLNGSLVMVVFDELPSTGLLDEDHRIDRGRYPNLAALAEESTWYPNAMASSDSTIRLLPALLTGRSPQRLDPTVRHYPQNLFTLLGGSVELTVWEPTSQLCPPSLCGSNQASLRERMGSLAADLEIVFLHLVLPGDLTAGLPPVGDNWGNFARQVASVPWEEQANYSQPVAVDSGHRFERFLESIESDGKPGLFFTHSLLPHIPYSYFPSGRRYNYMERPLGMKNVRWWSADQERIDRDYQLFLLQLGYVDTLVGKLIDRLKRLDLYDASLLVITADHGASFTANLTRRRLQRVSAAEILPVPLFIKTPYQDRGVVDRRPIQTIDVLPTVADLLDLQIPWEMDGLSAVDSDWPIERPIRAVTALHRKWRQHEFSLEELETRYDLLRRRLDLYGSGYGREFWALGRFAGLIGDRPKKRDIKSAEWLAATLNIPTEALSLEADSNSGPAFLQGEIRSTRTLETECYLAIGVNGVIRAVVPVDRLHASKRRRTWSAVVPEESFQPGENRIRVFLLRERNRGVKLLEAALAVESS